MVVVISYKLYDLTKTRFIYDKWDRNVPSVVTVNIYGKIRLDSFSQGHREHTLQIASTCLRSDIEAVKGTTTIVERGLISSYSTTFTKNDLVHNHFKNIPKNEIFCNILMIKGSRRREEGLNLLK